MKKKELKKKRADIVSQEIKKGLRKLASLQSDFYGAELGAKSGAYPCKKGTKMGACTALQEWERREKKVRQAP